MLDEFIMVWLRISKWILPIVLIQVLLLFFWEFLVQSGWLCISITLSLTLQCKNLHSFLLFFLSDWQGIKLWCWNCHQGKCLHYWAKKIVWEWYILNLLRIFIFFLQYLFLILGVSSGRIFQACGVFSGEIRTTRLVSLRKKDRMFVTSVRTFSVHILRYWQENLLTIESLLNKSSLLIFSWPHCLIPPSLIGS